MTPSVDWGWWHDAACTEVGHHMFFPDPMDPGARTYVKEAKAVCALCPVLVECLDDAYAIEAGQPSSVRVYGVRGGMAPWERAELYRSVAGA